MYEMNEWSKWLDEAVTKKHIKHYEYEHFKNIQVIGFGGFGKVYRAKWKNSYQYFALKSLHNIDEDAIKELVHEIELQRMELLFQIKRIKSNDTKKYLLVMEYADGGSLSNYLKKNFEKLTWEDILKLAYQLASAVSCLHDEGIIHRDLNSNNVLVNQDTIKLADFGLYPIEYVKLYTECWDDNPNNRTSIQEAVERLNTISSLTNIPIYQQNENIDKITDKKKDLKSIEVSSHGELSRIIIVKDHNKAFNLFTNVSERGHILAQHFVGRCYFYGCGTTKNVKLAFQYFERTANIAGNGNIIAMYNLGYSYKKGIGVEKDVNKAIYWYRKSAEQGYEYDAQNEIEKLTKKKILLYPYGYVPN
ncbi:unnamed protein product [Rhizophagus irregularis]|nr:unnamed protein product [Rhizophagus irregularis]